MIKKTYIPGKPRNPKLSTATGTSGVGKTEFNQVAGSSHEHYNKGVLDQITEAMLVAALRDLITSTDTESELTDENMLSSLRVLSEIAKNNESFLEDLKQRFLSKINPDTAQKLITFIEGIEVGTFTTGALGAGAAVKMIDGTSYAEVDNLTVRQKATFRELIIEALKHIGGQLVLTPARMKCVRVVDGGTYYKCYFDTGDGEVSNEFVAGDQARCQVFTGSGTKFYWRLVTSVGSDWINLSKSSAAVGSDVPEAGDDIVQLGNATDTTRQSAIILSTVGVDAPSWKQYSGINSFSLEGKETTVFSKLGNRIQGKTVFTSGGTNLEDALDGVGSDIQDAQATADGKSTTFLIQPTSYKLGDMWVLNADQTVNGTAYKAGEILTATQDSTTYNQAHWVKKVRYTDDTAVNDLQIGGRNLFNKSKLVVGYPQGEPVIPSIPINNDYGFQITGTAGTTNTRIRIPDVISKTGWWTVSCEVQGNFGNLPFSVNIAGMPKKNFTTGLATEWKRVEITSNVSGAENYVEFADIGYIVFKVRRLKIEKANKATDWTEAPEDTERELLEAQGYMKARYIRDYINGSSANNTNHWNELKVFNKAGVNIAIGKIPTSNGVLVNPANLTDNILNNFTHITPTPTTPTSQYIQIDLGQVHYDIDYIHVWHYYLDGRTYNGTKTQISEDGITWKTIFDSAVSGTYVETEGGKVHTQRYASVMDRIAETEAKTRFQTLIDGGLIYTALMKLFDTISGDETAFISGKQGAGKNLPAFGAGGSYQDALAGTAKAIIRHDGSSKFTDTEVTGTVNATSGSIGGLNIYDNAIASYPDLGVLVPPGEHIHISKTGVSIDRNVGLSQNQVITSVRITDDGIRVSKSDSDGYKSMEVRIDGIYRNGVKIL